MAKKTTWYCDRCGKEFKRNGFSHTVKIPRQISLLFYDGLRCISELEYDLCENCITDFMKFMGGRKLEDGN